MKTACSMFNAKMGGAARSLRPPALAAVSYPVVDLDSASVELELSSPLSGPRRAVGATAAWPSVLLPDRVRFRSGYGDNCRPPPACHARPNSLNMPSRPPATSADHRLPGLHLHVLRVCTGRNHQRGAQHLESPCAFEYEACPCRHQRRSTCGRMRQFEDGAALSSRPPADNDGSTDDAWLGLAREANPGAPR
jgi:hypothetical protein